MPHRIHWFEFHDFPWFPSTLRIFLTDLLTMCWTFGIFTSFHEMAMPFIKNAMKQTGTFELVDLCSGSGGPLINIQRDLKSKQNFHIKVTLTDLFPPTGELQDQISKRSNGSVQYFHKAVDATCVPPELDSSFSTMFTSLHHFKPEDARKIIQDVVTKNRGIGIFETQERSLVVILVYLILLPVLTLVFTPFLRPFRFDRLFWTYIIPVVPLFFLLDGITSCLRTYSPDELQQLIQTIDGHEKYEWQFGRPSRKDFPLICLNVLIGIPKAKSQ